MVFDFGLLFYIVLLLSIAAFVSAEMYWLGRRLLRPADLKLKVAHHDAVWSIIPALVLVALALLALNPKVKPAASGKKTLFENGARIR